MTDATKYYRWTRDQEAKLVQLVEGYVCKRGVKKWEWIAHELGGQRTATAIQSRYATLKKEGKKGDGAETETETEAETEEAEEEAEPEVEPEPEPEPTPEEEHLKNCFISIQEMAHTVAKTLGKGRVEGVYQRAMSIELQKKNMAHTMEEVITIPYEGITVGHERADIHIYDEHFPCILELKATGTAIQPKEHHQAISYMRTLKCSFGAVINFNQSHSGPLQIDFIILTDDGTPYIWNSDGPISNESFVDYA
jgi:GxxExxY protein